MRKANWAFINAGGSIVRRVAPELTKAENAQLTAVCSRSIERARAFADEFGVPDAYDNYADMLARDDIDIVYIGLPNYLHAEFSIMCMEAGKSVVCEKPMALNFAETKSMIEAAQKNGVFLMEGLWTKFFPAYKKVKEWIDKDMIGKPLFVEADFGVTMPSPDDFPEMKEAMAWRMDLGHGGGSISDLGVYCVSLALDILGGSPEEIQSHAKRFDTANGADMHNIIFMRYADGRFAHLSSSLLTRMPTVAKIYGEKGSIELGEKFWQPDRARLFINKGNPFGDEIEEEFFDSYFEQPHEGFKYEIEAASSYVLEGKKQAGEVSWDYCLQLSRMMDEVRSKWV